jgi:hypothetical protein
MGRVSLRKIQKERERVEDIQTKRERDRQTKRGIDRQTRPMSVKE